MHAAGPFVLVFSLTLIALVIRLWGLGQTNLWMDEVNSWEVVRLPWGRMFFNLFGSPVGPIYFVLLKPWVHLFGDSEAALRAPSLVAGVLLVPVTYLIGRRVLSPKAAVLGTLLLALSPLHLYLSQEARMYMLLALLAGTCALAYIRWRDAIAAPADASRPATWKLLVYAVAAAALMFTNPVAAPLLIAFNADAAIVFAGLRRAAPGRGWSATVVSWAAVNGGIVLLFVLYLVGLRVGIAYATQGWRPPLGVVGSLRALIQYPLTAVHGTTFYAEDFGRVARAFLADPTCWILQHEWRRFIVEPMTLLAIVAALRHVPTAGWRRSQRVLMLAVSIPLATGALVSVSRQLDLARYMLFASPFLFLLIGEGLDRMHPVFRWLSLATLLLAMGLGIARYEGVITRDSDYRPIAKEMTTDADADTHVVLVEPDVPIGMITYYLRDDRAIAIRRVSGASGVAAWLRYGPNGRAWLVFDYRSREFGASPAVLEAQFGARVLRDRYGEGVRLILIARRLPT